MYLCRSILVVNKLNIKNFSTNNWHFRSHYDSLGITPKATQNDIKSAYYKLSKIYHPDKNEGCPDASKKFHDISNAYEILGNFKLRRLYDKGLLHSGGQTYAHEQTVVHPEHPQAKFYESRHTGTTPVYDFDQWSKAHYGYAFERSQRIKQRWEAKQDKIRKEKEDIKSEKAIASILVVLFIILMYSLMSEDRNVDSIKTTRN